MAEIYRGTSQKVYLDIYGGASSSITAQLYVGDSSTPITLNPITETALTGATERWSVYVGLAYTQYDTELRIVWTFTVSGEPAVVEHVYEVVTPFSTVQEIRDNLTIPANVTDTQLQRVERRIRRVIQGICHQTFGKEVGDKVVVGQGDEKLKLPNRVITLTGIAGPYVFNYTDYQTLADGWWIQLSPLAPDGDVVFTNVIAAPDGISSTFALDVKYTLTAIWGYNDVPEEIKEATLLLIEDELCPQTTYANHYIEDVKFADTSMTFNPDVWTLTGNNTADVLISQWIRMNLMVI